MHLNPEAGSISTDYDPNSSTIGESASSGYWSRGEKETDKEEIPEKTPLDLDLEKIRPESLRLPAQMRVHRTQHEQISQNHIGTVHISYATFFLVKTISPHSRLKSINWLFLSFLLIAEIEIGLTASVPLNSLSSSLKKLIILLGL